MTTGTSRERSFVERLARIGEASDRATLAALRRGVGHEPGEVAEAARAFYSLLPGDVGWQERDYWLVATLYALHPTWRMPTDDGHGYTLAHALADFGRLTPGSANGAERLLLIMLRSDHDELPHHLRRAVMQLRSGGVAIEWEQLLRDLRWWGAPAKRVQQRWARDYWGARDDAGTQHTDEE